MSFLDSNISEINVPVMKPTQYVRVPTQATVTETGSKMTGWYDWLVNHVPGSIRKNVSSIFNTMKEKIVTLYDNSPVMKPTRYVKKPVRENVAKVSNEMRGWQDWLVGHVPDPIRNSVSSTFKTMRERIMGMYIPAPELVSNALRKRTEKWVIDGNGYKDPKIFLDGTTEHVERLVNNTDSIGKKVYTSLYCEMIRSDPETGVDTITTAHFRSKTRNIISEEDMTAKYPIMKSKILESLAEYQKLGSGWRIHSIE
jgi:hypothetical protein